MNILYPGSGLMPFIIVLCANRKFDIVCYTVLAVCAYACVVCDHAPRLPARRYLLRVTVSGKGMTADTKKEFPFWVRNYETPTEAAAPIKVLRPRCCTCNISNLVCHIALANCRHAPSFKCNVTPRIFVTVAFFLLLCR